MDRLIKLVLPRRVIVAAVAAIACATTAQLAAAATTPWAGSATSGATACESSTATAKATFKAFGDTSLYIPAPSGSLEAGATGWTLTGGAGVVTENEPFFVGARKDSHSLAIPAGGAATTPALCVGIEYPYSRLFLKGAAGSSLAVDLLYVDSAGNAGTFRLASVSGSGAWALSPRFLTGSLLLTVFSSMKTTSNGASYTAVAYRFTPSGGSWQVDDLYVDPFKLR